MSRRARYHRPGRRGSAQRRILNVEGLEPRIVLAAGIGFDRASRVVSIVGPGGNDSAEVRQQGANLVVSLNSAAGRLSRVVGAAQVSQIVFSGQAGNETFTNVTAIASRADGGAETTSSAEDVASTSSRGATATTNFSVARTTTLSRVARVTTG